MTRINLTQHNAAPEQDCLSRSEETAQEIKELLTFNEIPSLAEITNRAAALAEIAKVIGATEAMIGGAPYRILALDPALRLKGITPIYAFSRREVVEKINEDGSTTKSAVFRHLGFVRL